MIIFRIRASRVIPTRSTFLQRGARSIGLISLIFLTLPCVWNGGLQRNELQHQLQRFGLFRQAKRVIKSAFLIIRGRGHVALNLPTHHASITIGRPILNRQRIVVRRITSIQGVRSTNYRFNQSGSITTSIARLVRHPFAIVLLRSTIRHLTVRLRKIRMLPCPIRALTVITRRRHQLVA